MNRKTHAKEGRNAPLGHLAFVAFEEAHRFLHEKLVTYLLADLQCSWWSLPAVLTI